MEDHSQFADLIERMTRNVCTIIAESPRYGTYAQFQERSLALDDQLESIGLAFESVGTRPAEVCGLGEALDAFESEARRQLELTMLGKQVTSPQRQWSHHFVEITALILWARDDEVDFEGLAYYLHTA